MRVRMKRLFIHIAFFILLPCCITTIFAQEYTLPSYQLYGFKEGLPQIQMTALFQDSRGYIWAGTNNGIARFNGDRFFPFTAKNGFPFSYVNSFYEDKESRVWAVCRHGIACVSGDSIVAYPCPEYLLGRMSPGDADTLWLSATRREDDRYCLGYFIHGDYHFFDFEKDQPLFRGIADLEYDEVSKKLFIADTRDVYCYHNGVLEELNSPEMDVAFNLTNVIVIADELLLTYTAFQYSETRFYKLHQYECERIGILKDNYWKEPLPSDYKKHISYLNAKENYFMEEGELHEINIPEHLIITMLKDRENRYWYGAERGLLRIFSGTFINFNPAFLPEVWSVSEQPDGVYWFGSFSFGSKSMKDGRLSGVKSRGNEIESHYFHPAINEKGDIYFALQDGILKRSSDGAMKMLTYSRDSNHTVCFYTYYDAERNCLLGAFRGNVAVWDDHDNLIREIGRAADSNLSGYVHCIAQDSTRNYWFGSPDIYFYHWELDSLKQYASSADIQNCFDIATDHTGTTWFGTQKGLYYHDRNLDSLIHVDAPELQDWVLMVFPVDSGRLLLSQPDGLYVLDLDRFNQRGEYSFSVYNEANGYLGGEPGQAGAFRDSNGDIWITGSELLCRVNPEILPKNETLSIQPLFTRCNNIQILYGQQEVTLPLNQKSATVVLDAISYNRPRPVVYQYRKNENDDWSAPQNENYITFADLPHGKTPLYVRASFQGLSGLVANNERILTINVKRLFYNQAWFTPLVFFLLLVTVIVITIVQGKTYSKMQKALTQARVAEVETIQMQMNPHFVYNVLANVQSRIRNKSMEDAEVVLLKLSHLTRSFLHSITPQLSGEKEPVHNLGIDKNRLQHNRVTLETELNLLQEFVDFQQMLYPNRFVYLLRVGNDVDLKFVKMPPMLLQPFVENAISHGLLPRKSIGLLQVDIRKNGESGKTVIDVVDDGIGIERSEASQRLSKMSYPSRGRKLTMQRITLLNDLGFHIEVKTESSSAGTKITIEF